jgi:cellulose biosynthesis protein BcsQ
MGAIVTFYSYKGGTGRSMVLANVAYILAWQSQSVQRTVLMIDWDLEAPGLHKYFVGQLRSQHPTSLFQKSSNPLTETPGLIDFLHDIKDEYEKEGGAGKLSIECADTEYAEAVFERALRKCPLSKYILTVDPPDHIAQSVGSTAALFLMTAGEQTSSRYIKQVRGFDWQQFYERYGSFFALLRERLATNYDVVLIDSRTGLTDIGDICTRVMPEKLVAVFAPNTQNIDGLLDIVRGAAEYRRSSRDPRSLVVLPLASRIDGSREVLRRIWSQGGKFGDEKIVGYETRFQDLFKSIYQLEECDLHDFFNSTQVPHDGDYSYGERISAASGLSDRWSISFSCSNLAQYIIRDRLPWKGDIQSGDVVNDIARTTASPASTARLQPTTPWAFTAMLTIILMVGVGVGYLQWDKGLQLAESKQQLDQAQANILAELSGAKLMRGDLDGALRLALSGTLIELKLPPGAVKSSPAAAALAAALSRANWLLSLVHRFLGTDHFRRIHLIHDGLYPGL